MLLTRVTTRGWIVHRSCFWQILYADQSIAFFVILRKTKVMATENRSVSTHFTSSP